MSKIDFTDLDGKVLRAFLTILEESSVSRAADRLGVTQSAVSHTLSKLRAVLGDPLFVRSGQGLMPTERALANRAFFGRWAVMGVSTSPGLTVNTRTPDL